jgi:hypothetical protein
MWPDRKKQIKIVILNTDEMSKDGSNTLDRMWREK